MQLSVNQRLLAIMGGAVLALLVTGLIGFLSSQKISDELKFTDENIIRSLAILSSAERDFLLVRVNALYHLSYDDPEKKAPHEATIRRNTEDIRKRLTDYDQNLVINARDRELMDQDLLLFDIYLDALERVLQKSNARDRAGAVVVIENDWKPAGERLTFAFTEHMRYKEQLVDQLVQQSMNSGRRSGWILVWVTLVAVVFVILIGYLFKRSLPTKVD